MNGYHEVRIFSVPLEELAMGWAGPVNYKPFAIEFVYEEARADIVCRRWHRGEDTHDGETIVVGSTADFDADAAETIEAHEIIVPEDQWHGREQR